ncbi:MAG: TolC family protein [Bacteroidia bacterium]|nr:TolC family protein [Bacteroidia bacterium]
MRRVLTVLSFLAASVSGWAQQMTMSEVISTARRQSVAALQTRQEFISVYWAWRSYQASRLPSLFFYGGLMNYNRSLVLLQNYDDGTLRYASTNNLQNSLGLRIRQHIPLTGGTLTAYSDLSRIDQFGMEKSLTWYSQPITISYTQPLFAYNEFKWEKLIEPKEYEKGRRAYIESMEQITIDAVEAYSNLLLARTDHEIAKTNYGNSVKMHDVARERLSLGSVTRDEYLQLELRMLNDSIAINESLVALRDARMNLNSLLGYDESVEIDPVLPENLPDVVMDYEMVLDRSLQNSTFSLGNEIDILNARSAVEKAKADRGISMSLNARFGLSDTAPELPGAYKNPLDQEVAGLSFSIPIFDWGLGRGKVQKAKAAEAVVRAQVEQSENDYRRSVFTAVGQFNNQRRQCEVSRRARNIAAERDSLMMDKFRSGGATVTDLNTARSESDAALQKYITDISNYWLYYHRLRQYSLYDFINGADIDVDPEEMMEE